jgi:hypothetical protein
VEDEKYVGSTLFFFVFFSHDIDRYTRAIRVRELISAVESTLDSCEVRSFFLLILSFIILLTCSPSVSFFFFFFSSSLKEVRSRAPGMLPMAVLAERATELEEMGRALEGLGLALARVGEMARTCDYVRAAAL